MENGVQVLDQSTQGFVEDKPAAEDVAVSDGSNTTNFGDVENFDEASVEQKGAIVEKGNDEVDQIEMKNQSVEASESRVREGEASSHGQDPVVNQVHSYKDALLHDVQPDTGSLLTDEREPEKEELAFTNGHVNPSEELKQKAVDVEITVPTTEPVNGSDKGEHKQIDGEIALHTPDPVDDISKDEEQQIDVEKALHSPQPVDGNNKDEDQRIHSPEPVDDNSKGEEQQIDGEKTRHSPELVDDNNKDEDQPIDGEKALHSPEPVDKDEKQQIDGEIALHSPEPVDDNNKDEEQMVGIKAVANPDLVTGANKDEQQINGSGDDNVSALQGGISPFKAEITEKESASPELKAHKDMVEQKEILNGDATDHQGPSLNRSLPAGSENLNGKADVSSTSASENHAVRGRVTAEDDISDSSQVLLSDGHDKVSKVSQHPPVDAGVGVDKGVVNELVKAVIVEDLKQSVPRDREPEPRPAVEQSSSSGASTTRGPTPTRPAGLGGAAPLLEPAHRVVQQPRVNGTASPAQNQLVEESTNREAEEYDETREKLQMIRVKFLRLAHRLGQGPHNVVVAQVLYRLGLAEQLRGRNGGRVTAFSFDRASAMAEQLEAAGQEPLDFSCTIMVLGKTGVGKSATINSIFDEVKFGTDAFQLGTKKIQDVVGTVQGIKVRVIDTPGLLPSWSDQRQNEKILHSVKRFMKKTPPDIVLYLDRLDMQCRDYGDMPLLRTITEILEPSIWFNAIVVLTHAASAPPEGPNGTVTSYDMFVTQRSHVVQQAIRQAAGDMRLMNPVSLVENHSACRTNRAGQRVLPNGQVWKPHLLLLSFASKILAEANTLLKLQDSPPGRPFATRTRSPPLPFLLSSLLQSRPQVKLPTEQFGDEDEGLDDLDESSDSEDESKYDQLPTFKRLTKAQLAKLSKDQRKAYNDELEYREKLFMKKQLKEERKRRRMLKKMQAAAADLPTDPNGNVEEETGAAASVPVPMPDLALPASFDSDNPTHRYRYLDSSNQWLVRPVLEPNGWDHDVGYEGINVERLFVVKDKIPISFSSQVSKDKKDTNLQMEVASSVKHGDGKATSLGFDMQSVGKDIAYTLRSETRFSNYRRNKATAGLSVTYLGDVMTGGVKVEDKLTFNKRGQLVVSGGAMFGRGDVAYGGSLEATLRDKDHPLGRFLTTLGLSVMDWHGDLAIGCNSQTQIPIGRYTNLIGRVNINNKGSGQVSIRLNSSEQLQIALISLLPLVRKLISYSQPAQFG